MNHQENKSMKSIPLEPHVHTVKLGVFLGIGKPVFFFFLILLQNIDCGYSLEPPRRGGLNVNPQFMYVCFFSIETF